MLGAAKRANEMQAPTEAHGMAEGEEMQDELGRLCDFCGDRVTTVRRVALDQEYDRLQKVHQEQYSCASCFEAKEKRRLGLTRR